MKRSFICCSILALALCAGAEVKPPPAVGALEGQRIAFIGDSITQGGMYTVLTEYVLRKTYPQLSFECFSLGLASETLSGLSEPEHLQHGFPRPCVFERLGRLLEKAKPDIVFACYGMNDAIYMPLDDARFAAFKDGVNNFVKQCQASGVKRIYLLTPPIYDDPESVYKDVLKAYADWEMGLALPGVQPIDVQSVMRAARDKQAAPFSPDKVHPDSNGHWVMAQAILQGLGVPLPKESLAEIQADGLFKLVQAKRNVRSNGWMPHIGYTREKTVAPQPLGDTEEKAAAIQKQIEAFLGARNATP